jgi:hypothetical protein
MNELYKKSGGPDKITGLNKTSVFRIGGLLLVLVGGFALAVWYLFNFAGSDSKTSSNVVSYSAKQPDPLTVLDWAWNTWDTTDVDGKPIKVSDKTINGRVKNNSSRQYSYVQVGFNLYDADNNHVGTAVANTNNLEPNSTWKFTATPLMVGTGQIKTAKLKGVTGF